MIIVGHRGARGLMLENTLASIKKAIACGVDEVEIDVRVTRDGIPILSHDKSLATNTSNEVLRTASHTLAELRNFKPDTATLADALKLVADRSVLLIEVKHGESVDPISDVIRAAGVLTRQKPSIMLGSKSQKILRRLHGEFPDIPVVVIEPWSGVRASYRARQLGTNRISMRSWWLWKGFLKGMYRRGYQIVPYTMNDPKKVAKWLPYIHGVVTDYPDRFIGFKVT